MTRGNTFVLPAGKNALSSAEIAVISDGFEDIERTMFGEDELDGTARRIGRVEGLLGLTDLAPFAALPLPRRL